MLQARAAGPHLSLARFGDKLTRKLIALARGPKRGRKQR